MNYCVYRYTNKINGKKYVGYTNNLIRRNKEHYNSQRNQAFYNAIKKYGWKNFEDPKILCECKTEKQAKKKEIWWIKKLQSYTYGYNMTLGGDGNNMPRTEEWKRKISLSLLGKPGRSGNKHHYYGKHRKKETCEKIFNTLARNWIITFPDGHQEKIKGLKKFCRLYNLHTQHIKNKSKGFSCVSA